MATRKGMKNIKRVQNIRTVRALLDGRRVRTAAGALMELSALANQRLRLEIEQNRWRQRLEEIDKRLGEMAVIEAQLRLIIQSDMVEPQALPLPMAEAPRGFISRELNY